MADSLDENGVEQKCSYDCKVEILPTHKDDTDMLAAIIQKYLRHYSIAQIMQFIDGAIVVVGMYVFGVERALYAIIAVFLVTSVSASSLSPIPYRYQRRK
mgnify:CR=1 FL=1